MTGTGLSHAPELWTRFLVQPNSLEGLRTKRLVCRSTDTWHVVTRKISPGLEVWNHTRVRGWDRWITARRAQRGGLWFTVSNPSTSALIAFLTCTNSGSKCNNLCEPKLQLKSRPGTVIVLDVGHGRLFFSSVHVFQTSPKASFAKQNSASAMMLTSRLRVEVWRCSNANHADTLVPHGNWRERSTRPELRRFFAVSLLSGWHDLWSWFTHVFQQIPDPV